MPYPSTVIEQHSVAWPLHLETTCSHLSAPVTGDIFFLSIHFTDEDVLAEPARD